MAEGSVLIFLDVCVIMIILSVEGLLLNGLLLLLPTNYL